MSEKKLALQCADMLEKYLETARKLPNNSSSTMTLEGQDMTDWKTVYYPQLVQTGKIRDGVFFENPLVNENYGIGKDGSCTKYEYVQFLWSAYRFALGDFPSQSLILSYARACVRMLEPYAAAFENHGTGTELRQTLRGADMDRWNLTFYHTFCESGLIPDGAFFGDPGKDPNLGIGADGTFGGAELCHFLFRLYRLARTMTQCEREALENRHVSPALPLQKDFNKALSEKVTSVMAAKLDGGFVAAAYPSGFNYGVTYGTSAYYNELTLSTLNSTLFTDSDGVTSISNEKLADLYRQVLTASYYQFSQATRQELNEWDNAAEAQVAAVLEQFEAAGFKYTDPLPVGGKLADVFDQLEAKYGTLTEDMNNIPVYLNSLKDALMSYIEAAGQAFALHARYSQANGILGAAVKNAANPSKDNGALQTGEASYYVGFEHLPTANQLIGSLGTKENALTVKLSGESSQSNAFKVQVDGGAFVTVPANGIMDLSIDEHTTVDIGSLTSEKTTFSISLTYPGLTVVANKPMALTADKKKGWYAETILTELREKTGDENADGYKLMGREFTVDELFGMKGRLNYFKTFVISAQPAIDVEFKHIDISEFKKHVSTEIKVTVDLFGFIRLGTTTVKYTLDEAEYNEAEQSVRLHLSAPEVSGTVPLKEQVAHVLGGVPVYT